MRIAYTVPKHREYMYSGSPSEPVLAEAAAQAMSSMLNVVEPLASYVRNGLIQKGERGELVARLLLTLAHDHACEKLASKKEESSQFPKYSQPVSVEAFLRELLSKDFIDDILNSTPENDSRSRTSLRTAFEGATIRFSHFAKAGDKSGTTSAVAAAAYIRGLAFQLTNCQPFIDIMIPIHFTNTPRGSNTLVPEAMSAIFISVKNRVQAMYHSVDEKQLGFFTAGGNTQTRPYIVIVMNLGTSPPVSEPPQLVKQAHHSAPSTQQKKPTTKPRPSYVAGGGTPPPQGPLTRSQAKAKVIHPYPRYWINITGCSSTVYNVVKDSERANYAELLGTSNVETEYPFESEGAIEGLRRLKPDFKVSSYDHWVRLDDRIPHPIPEETDAPEGVTSIITSDIYEDMGVEYV